MEQFWQLFVGLFTDLRGTLTQIVNNYHMWTYAILFAIIFCETGFVVTPFLPGDSLLFAVGALAAAPGSILDPLWLFLLLSTAAILGDTVNYWIGHLVGPKVFHKENVRFLNKEHLHRAHQFYERHGGKTIILARFMPFIRTFAPFVAGIGSMTYWKFLAYNVTGGVLWIGILFFGGYKFAAIPWVDKNFELVILAIVIISLTPPAIEYLRHRRASGQQKT